MTAMKGERKRECRRQETIREGKKDGDEKIDIEVTNRERQTETYCTS